MGQRLWEKDILQTKGARKMLKKLAGFGMAATMALTIGFGFAGKADAAYEKEYFIEADPYLGKDGHVYVDALTLRLGDNSNYQFGVYKMYELEQGIITAVNVYDDTDIIRFSENRHEYKNQGYITVAFTEKNNNDYKVHDIRENWLILDGLLSRNELDQRYDVHTYKVSWMDNNYVYLYTKNHLNPHEIKLPREGFEFLSAGDWLWAKVSEETWSWTDYREIVSRDY